MISNLVSPSATYTKLRDGSWGIRVNGSASVGESVTVTTQAGQTKTERVARVLWTGNGITLCTIEQRARPVARSYSRGGFGDGMVRCVHCHRRTPEGDDWCMCCGAAGYER